MRLPVSLIALGLLLLNLSGAQAAAPEARGTSSTIELKEGNQFPSRDSLSCGPESVADATLCLDGLKWRGGPFDVRLQPGKAGFGDWLVRFPTPLPSGDATNDLVAMEWYVARDAEAKPIKAPAVVVVHESGRGMVAGRMFARGLQRNGFHTFLIHLPGYGERTSPFTRDMKQMLPAFRQAIGDVRRAKDAVAVLPFVDPSTIAVQGTSLGGFVVATVAGLDRGYTKSFILLAGGQLADVLLKGNRDAAAMRRRLAQAGVDDEQIKALSQIIEPMRLAHRVDAAQTWLFSGKFDEVVPPSSSQAFANAAKLGTNHLVLPVGHYSAVVLFPMILPKISELMRQ
jgi:dienelactone hydrolase